MLSYCLVSFLPSYSEESAKLLVEKGIPVTVVPDSAMGAVMDRADLCLVGAEGVMENGGIINKVCRNYTNYYQYYCVIVY